MRKGKLRRTLMRATPIYTERLVLRNIEPGDANDMYEYASVPEVTKYLLWEPHVNLDATSGYIRYIQTRYLRGLYADWAVALKESGKMIGTCGYANIDSGANECEIGYVLSPYYRKRGFMTEAVEAVLSLTFETLGFDRAKLRIMDGNADSCRLAERCGFTLESVIPDELVVKGVPRTLRHYSLTKTEYENSKGCR